MVVAGVDVVVVVWGAVVVEVLVVGAAVDVVVSPADPVVLVVVDCWAGVEVVVVPDRVFAVFAVLADLAALVAVVVRRAWAAPPRSPSWASPVPRAAVPVRSGSAPPRIAAGG